MVPTGIGDDLWQKAFDLLSPSSIRKLDPAKTGVRDIAAVLRVANAKFQLSKKKQWKIKKSNGHEVIVVDVIEKIVHWINRFRAIGDNAVQFDPVHAALPWTAVRFLLQAAVNDSLVRSSMVEDLELVVRVVARFREVESLYRSTPLSLRGQIEEAMVETYVVILKFLAAAVQFYSDSTMVRLLKAPFRAVDEKMRDSIVMKETEVFNLAKLIDGGRILNIEKVVSRLADRILPSRQEVEEKTYLAVLQWLSDVPYSRIHEGFSKSRVPGTGEWLLQHPEFRSWWLSSRSSQLLLHGIPGCGKTLLCSAVIDKHLDDMETASRTAHLAYFYCTASESERERRTPEGVLRCLARQLTTSRSPVLRVHGAVMAKYNQVFEDARLDGFTIPKAGISDCVDFILAALEDNPVTIVVDALDEIDEPGVVVDALNGIAMKSSKILKLFLSSRDDSITSLVAHFPVNIRVTEEFSKADVREFATRTIDRAVSDCKLLRGSVRPGLRDRVVDALAQQAGEMFRWVELQVLKLCDLDLETDVLTALDNFEGSTLNSLYRESYSRIAKDSVSARVATHTFSWLLYMREPLSSAALSSAVACALESSEITLDSLLTVCRRFVRLDRQSKVVRFAHPSAREFLRLQPEYNPATANGVLARCCLSICRNPPEGELVQFESTERTYDYAALYVGDHCSAAGLSDTSSSLFQELYGFFFDGAEPSLPFMMWMDNVKFAYPSLPRDHPQEPAIQLVRNQQNSALFFLCVFGLSPILTQHTWPVNYDWNLRSDSGHSGLYAATYFGRADIVAFLLAQGAEIDAQGGRLGSALHCSAFRGHVEVVRTLLNHGANAKLGGKFENAFQAACRGSCEAAIAILDHQFMNMDESDIESLSGSFSEAGFAHALIRLHQHPLHASSTMAKPLEHGRKAIMSGNVTILLHWLRKFEFANVVPRGGLALSALHGHEAMTTYLLDNGMDVEEAGDLGSPLRCASLQGYNSVCQILLARGADVNGNDHFGNALHAAAMKGHLHTARLLLASGASVNAQGGFYGTSLQASAFHGHKELVSHLLAAGASPYLSGFTSDAFHAAAEGGRQDIIMILLEAGYVSHSPEMRGKPSLLRSNAPQPLPHGLLQKWRLRHQQRHRLFRWNVAR